MTEYEYRKKLDEITQKGKDLLRYQSLKELKDSYKKPKSKIQFTKIALLLVFLFVMLNCTFVEAISCYAMITLGNLDALPGLISAVITESFTLLGTFIAYSFKSFLENKEEASVQLEYDKMNIGIEEYIQQEPIDDSEDITFDEDEFSEDSVG